MYMVKGTFFEPLAWWVYSSIAVTGLLGCTYLAVQQNYRQNANDPQIQLAEDGAAKLNDAGVPADLVPKGVPLTNLETSLDTWIAVYDQNGVPLEASAQLHNLPPQPPKSLFDSNTWTDLKTFRSITGPETRVSWQPQAEVRQAIVLVKTANGYTVVVGRSMRLAEERVEQLTLNIGIGWLSIEAALFVASFVGWFLLKEKK